MSTGYLFSSESVTEGHPDKLADQISDAVLDAMLEQDSHSRVACETLVTTGVVFVSGEITLAKGWVDIPSVVRRTITEVGYTDAKFGLDGETCGVVTAIQEQSADIAVGVDHALEERQDHSSDDLDHQGAGDQGMMFGYACRDTDELMPMPIAMAHRLSRRLSDVRKAGVVPYLRPDGKSQVSIEYVDGKPIRVDTVLISAQHREEVDVETLLRPDVEAEVIDPVLREFPELSTDGVRVLVNPTGRFEIGRLHGALRREERRRRRPRRAVSAPGRLRDRHGAPGIADDRDVRHRDRGSRARREGRLGHLRLPAGGDHPRPRSGAADLRRDGGLRPLRPEGIPVGGHRSRRRAPKRRRRLRSFP